MNQGVSYFQQCSEMIVDFCVQISSWLISLTASKMLESVKDLLYNPKPCTTLSVILEKEVYACWLVLSVFFASFHSKVSKVWKQKTNSERSKGSLVTTLYQFLNYVFCLYCLNSKCEFFRGKLPSIFEPWRLSGMLTNTMAGQNTDSCLRPRQQQSRYFWKPLLTQQWPNINFLLTLSIHFQEIRLGELIKWSLKRKCHDLSLNSLN